MQATWLFARGDDRIELQRQCDPELATTLVVRLNGEEPKTYGFAEGRLLLRFQHDMEQFLLGSGWLFTGFCPDRRTGHERRSFPRLLERRRWWTG